MSWDPVWHIRLVRFCTNHGLERESKLFSSVKNVQKVKAYFLELQVQQAISRTLYELGTSGLAYLTRYNQYLTIL